VKSLALGALVALFGVHARAQEHEGHTEHRVRPWMLGARAIGLITRADAGPAGIVHTEGYLTQPMVMAGGDPFSGHLFARLTLNLEGTTLERGELNLAGYGEGYVDRRHPHAYLHEAIGGARGSLGGFDLSIAGGKGFVPFGSEDPMMRPFVKYPVNHHLAQLLERLIVSGAVRRGRVTVEGATFNGDEPVAPGSAPNGSRFGDSWATRVTLNPLSGFEIQGSYASVEAPEDRFGRSLDHRKWHFGGRYDGNGRLRYALLEWARTAELHGEIEAFHFVSTNAEATVAAGPVDVSLRVERTTRPEEERLLDPFRSVRPLTDVSVIGVTRWTTTTVAVERLLARAPVFGASAFVEAEYLRPHEQVHPTVFVPRDFYRSQNLWMVSVGVRVAVGHQHHVMGRYGAAAPP
jgi:hypothetical protein